MITLRQKFLKLLCTSCHTVVWIRNVGRFITLLIVWTIRLYGMLWLVIEIPEYLWISTLYYHKQPLGQYSYNISATCWESIKILKSNLNTNGTQSIFNISTCATYRNKSHSIDGFLCHPTCYVNHLNSTAVILYKSL